MCHDVLHDPDFLRLLDLIDEERARAVRARGCACGGVLHSARYPRKPRGILRGLRDADHRRRSVCCAACRLRHTPRSVIYLGRRVYVTVLVLLGACAARIGVGARCASCA